MLHITNITAKMGSLNAPRTFEVRKNIPFPEKPQLSPIQA